MSQPVAICCNKVQAKLKAEIESLSRQSVLCHCEVHTLRDPLGYPSGGSPLIGTVTPGPNWPFLSPP